MDAEDTRGNSTDDEYPDDAGYPDGKGTLDEGTGAFSGAAGPTGDEAADDGGRDDTGAGGEAAVDRQTGSSPGSGDD